LMPSTLIKALQMIASIARIGRLIRLAA